MLRFAQSSQWPNDFRKKCVSCGSFHFVIRVLLNLGYQEYFSSTEISFVSEELEILGVHLHKNWVHIFHGSIQSPLYQESILFFCLLPPFPLKYSLLLYFPPLCLFSNYFLSTTSLPPFPLKSTPWWWDNLRGYPLNMPWQVISLESSFRSTGVSAAKLRAVGFIWNSWNRYVSRYVILSGCLAPTYKEQGLLGYVHTILTRTCFAISREIRRDLQSPVWILPWMLWPLARDSATKESKPFLSWGFMSMSSFES